MKHWVKSFERWLHMPAGADPEQIMRVRAVWMISLIMAGSQIFNLRLMTFIYGRWTYDHSILAAGILIVAAATLLLRVWKKPFTFALFYCVLLLVMVLGSALPDIAGINTAALPMLALGLLMAGLMAGRRAAIAFWFAAALVIVGLYLVTLGAPSMVAPYDYSRETNRMFQALAAVSIATGVAVIVQERLYGLLADMRETAARAQRAEAVKSQFLATMSHELRTPLNGVIGLTDALLDGPLPARERLLTETIRSSGEALLLILNDLLDLSKIEAGRLTIEPRPADLRETVRFVADSWRETAAAKGITIGVSVAGDAPLRVMVDDHRLRQVLQSLLSNAVKFTEAGQIAVSVTGAMQPDGSAALAFRVRDTGRGVPADQVERIFDPFEQGDSGTTRQFGGTGLGLPISRMLMNLMGGDLRLEKTGPDGSTFLAVLSAAAAPAEAEPADGGAIYDAAGDITGLRVLVAEDNQVNRMVVAEFLKSWGAEPDFAEDGAVCVERFTSRRYDIVLMDKHMPGMNGVEAARAIRARGGPGARVPIIAVTADAMPGEHEAMIAAGMDDFVAKPIRADVLKAAMLRALAARKAA